MGDNDTKKNERLLVERKQLIDRIAASNLINVRDKVAYILNHYPDARNSDIMLFYKYWEIFQPDLFGRGQIGLIAAMKLERQTTITRARAKIQNEYGLFQARDSVKSKRKQLDDEERAAQVLDKPEESALLYFVDESSKNESYILVGGLCFFDGKRMFNTIRRLSEWKDYNDIKYEFHFSELTKHKLDNYKRFFSEALSMSDIFSLHAIAVQQGDIKDINSAIYDMHYQLVIHGTKHEIDSKRITIPREVLVYKDKDEPMDKLMLTKLRQDYEAGFRDFHKSNLKLQLLESVDSKDNLLMQITDIFIGSLARKLNKNNEIYNQKDELADYVFDVLRFSLSDEESFKRDNVFFFLL